MPFFEDLESSSSDSSSEPLGPDPFLPPFFFLPFFLDPTDFSFDSSILSGLYPLSGDASNYETESPNGAILLPNGVVIAAYLRWAFINILISL